MLLAGLVACAAAGALGYVLGRRQDARDIRTAPVDFEKAIERIVEPEPAKPPPQVKWAVYTPEPVHHHPKVKRAVRKRGRK